MQTKTLFMMEDTLLGQSGLYAMWTILYISNLIVLAEDDTKGPSRDFNIIANGLSVLYCGLSGANMIYGNKLPSTMLMVIGPIHQYLFWMLFAYYGAGDVLGSHPIGVYNWVTLFVVGLFTVDMVGKTWLLSLNPQKYIDYVAEKCSPVQDQELEEVSVEEDHQKVAAKFTFKEGKLKEFMTMMQDPETGLSVTQTSEGYIDIEVLVDQDHPDVLVLAQKWKTKENHQAYVQKRKDSGMFDKLVDMLEVEPEIRYVKSAV
jgi:quinol monooxygenase YgiN